MIEDGWTGVSAGLEDIKILFEAGKQPEFEIGMGTKYKTESSGGDTVDKSMNIGNWVEIGNVNIGVDMAKDRKIVMWKPS